VLLIDASVWLAALDEDDRFYESARSVIRSGAELAALDLTLYEVANTVTRRFGEAPPTAAAIRVLLDACRGRLVQIDADTIVIAAEIAVEHSLTAYDAAYVAVARRNGWTLVSVDLKDLVNRGLALAPDDPGIGTTNP
jgi:predicted nucleic acid-binding protein